MTSAIVADLEKTVADVESSVVAHLKTVDASVHAGILNFLSFFKTEVAQVKAAVALLESKGYTVTAAVKAVEGAAAAIKAAVATSP